MTEQKKNWREEVEQKLATAKSPSQRFRFALFHVWEKTEDTKKMNFEDFYQKELLKIEKERLDECEK